MLVRRFFGWLPAALGLFSATPGSSASAQVAYVPVVGAFPNGVTLSATPVVSADRRYVRLGMNPQFTGLEGFDTYSVPGAVSGGGLRSVAYGMDGPLGMDGYGYGPEFLPSDSPTASAVLGGGVRPFARPRLAPVPSSPPPKAARKKAKRGKTR